MAPSELGPALSGALRGPGDQPELTVTDVRLIRLGDATSAALSAVVQIAARDLPLERWEWHLPLSEDEFAMPAITFLETIRANLEEWWHVKDREPHFAALGHRLPLDE